MKDLAVIVLAAGRSKRMRTEIPKALHKAGGKCLIDRVMDAVKAVSPSSVHVVVGYEKEQIMAHLGDSVSYAEQKELLGTGHAAWQAVPNLKDENTVMIINCDMPMITGRELESFCFEHEESGSKISLMSAVVPWESDFGRIIRDKDGNATAIREYRDASEEERKIKEVNLALYLFDRKLFEELVPMISSENDQKEYYLTDLIEMAAERGEKVLSHVCADPDVSRGVNSRSDLAEIDAVIRRKTIERLMDEGVSFTDPSTVYIYGDVKIGIDTVIHPFTFIDGNTVIGRNCVIGPSSSITDCRVGDRCSIVRSVAISSEIGNDANIGPFSYIRPGNRLADKVKVGDFVELKNSVIGAGTKVPHLSYVGDAELGSKVNIGAGTITCNYDGKNKHRTVIGDNSKIGSNTNLVAPVTVGKNVVTGAGAVVINDALDNSTVVGVPAKPINK